MMNQKESQDKRILRIVGRKKNQKTYEIIRQGLDNYITHGDRCLRRLAEIGFVFGERAEGKTYKQWNITPKGRDFLNKK